MEFIKQVLWTVVCVREPVTQGALAELLNANDEQVSAALEPLRSVLHVSEGSEVVSTLHASFSDFILSSERSGPWLHCKETAHSEYLARRCFELIKLLSGPGRERPCCSATAVLRGTNRTPDPHSRITRADVRGFPP